MKTTKYIAITALAGTILSGVFFENYLLSQNTDPIRFAEGSSYKTAIGLRGGSTSGLTIKQFTSDNMALEGIIGIWPFSMSATGLIEFYAPAQIVGLNWYYGFGGHVAFETGRIYYASEVNGNGRYFYREGELGLGLDGILGIEYKILPIPFALSLDIKPFLEVNTEGRAFMAIDPGLGVKFAF